MLSSILCKRILFVSMINYLNRLLKGKKKKEIGLFFIKKKLYLKVAYLRKNHFFYSVNGFDFKTVKGKINQKLLKSTNKDNYNLLHLIAPGSENLPTDKLTIEASIEQKDGRYVFYHYQRNGRIETSFLVVDDQNNLIWRHHQPIWQSPLDWQEYQVSFVSLIKHKGKIISYWYLVGQGLFAVLYPKYKMDNLIEVKHKGLLNKPDQNPLIAPNPKNSWEAFTTFNPAAIYEADKVHLLYRAQGHDYRSVLGYASSQNGVSVDYKQNYPCYIPTQPFEKGKKGKFNPDFVSGGSCEGCEDPRITRIDDRIYMTYVAFNGWDPPRIALTSIALTDFLDKRWLWTRPVLISPPNIVDKSACILPEKIGGKYVIFHRIFPNILIDFVDSLDFSPGQYLKGQYKITPRSPLWWDSRKIGVAAPPLKTKQGWLLIYQAVDDKSSGHYSVGAMLLKLNDPTQVIYRSRTPIIEPDKWYDNEGFKAGVVYPCGSVIIDDTLFVYYGGADSHVCVATAPLDQFLNDLMTTGTNQLDPTIIRSL